MLAVIWRTNLRSHLASLGALSGPCLAPPSLPSYTEQYRPMVDQIQTNPPPLLMRLPLVGFGNPVCCCNTVIPPCIYFCWTSLPRSCSCNWWGLLVISALDKACLEYYTSIITQPTRSLTGTSICRLWSPLVCPSKPWKCMSLRQSMFW
jgi:hypothetical protein